MVWKCFASKQIVIGYYYFACVPFMQIHSFDFHLAYCSTIFLCKKCSNYIFQSSLQLIIIIKRKNSTTIYSTLQSTLLFSARTHFTIDFWRWEQVIFWIKSIIYGIWIYYNVWVVTCEWVRKENNKLFRKELCIT